MRSEALFNQIVERHLMSIMLALSQEAANGEDHNERFSRLIESKQVEDSHAELDFPAEAAELLNGSNFFIGDAETEPTAFHFFKGVSLESYKVFRFARTLHGSITDRKFVSFASEIIFGRLPGEAILTALSTLIERGQKSRSEILKELASIDGSDRNRAKVLIVPNTSRWLSRIKTPVASICFQVS